LYFLNRTENNFFWCAFTAVFKSAKITCHAKCFVTLLCHACHSYVMLSDYGFLQIRMWRYFCSVLSDKSRPLAEEKNCALFVSSINIARDWNLQSFFDMKTFFLQYSTKILFISLCFSLEKVIDLHLLHKIRFLFDFQKKIAKLSFPFAFLLK